MVVNVILCVSALIPGHGSQRGLVGKKNNKPLAKAGDCPYFPRHKMNRAGVAQLVERRIRNA